MSEEQKHEEGEDVPEYKVSKKVDMATLMEQDANDESLRKYKESLGLGKIDDAAARKNIWFTMFHLF